MGKTRAEHKKNSDGTKSGWQNGTKNTRKQKHEKNAEVDCRAKSRLLDNKDRNKTTKILHRKDKNEKQC